MTNQRHDSLIDLFTGYANRRGRQLRRDPSRRPDASGRAALAQLLNHPQLQPHRAVLQRAFTDPYFPLDMVSATLFADVTGMRFYINKRRRELEPRLAAELRHWASAFVAIRGDIDALFDPARITCIPLDGIPHHLPDGQWCTLCGICCRIGGVPATSPAGVHYPPDWNQLLTGDRTENQQVCPFLFQYFGRQLYFCSIHTIKPLACRSFGVDDCRQRLAEPDLHG